MPSKQAPSLNRIVKHEACIGDAKNGQWLPELTYTRSDLRALVKRVAAECARIAEGGLYGTEARAAVNIREAFGLEHDGKETNGH